MENAYIDVHPGQIWADNDRRSAGRRLEVLSTEGEYAFCKVIQLAPGVYLGLGSTKKLRISRFRPTSTGYLLLSDPSTGYVRPEQGEPKWVKPDTARGIALVAEKAEDKKPVKPRKLPASKPIIPERPTAGFLALEADVPVDFILMIHPKYPTDSETVDNFYAKNAKKIWDAARADLLVNT